MLLVVFVVMFIGYSFSADIIFEKVLEPHQKIRIETLLGLKEDPQGAEWNTNQSKIAISSGRMFGKGFLKGTQTKLKFVPEQDTDFVGKGRKPFEPDWCGVYLFPPAHRYLPILRSKKTFNNQRRRGVYS